MEQKATSFVTDRPLTPRVHAIFDEAIGRANEKHKAEFGESIYAPGLRDWARSKGLDAPPVCWPCGFTRVTGDPLSWQPFDWLGRLIGEPWRFKRALDAGDLCFNVWGDAIDDDGRVGFELSERLDPGATWREEYFYSMGEVLDETVDPLRYAAILMQLPADATATRRQRGLKRPNATASPARYAQ